MKVDEWTRPESLKNSEVVSMAYVSSRRWIRPLLTRANPDQQGRPVAPLAWDAAACRHLWQIRQEPPPSSSP